MRRYLVIALAAVLIGGAMLMLGAHPTDLAVAAAGAAAVVTRESWPIQARLAPIESVDAKKRTVELVWTTGARVKRYDWRTDTYYMEELSCDPKHVRLGRFQAGAPLLDTHGRYSLSDILGVIEDGSARLDGKRGTATVRFSEREEVAPIFKDVQDKIIRNVSVGYGVYKWERMAPDDTSEGLPIMRAVDWEPVEISLVPVGADAGAGVRSNQQQQDRDLRSYPCEITDRTAQPAATNKEQRMEKEEQERLAAAEAERKLKAEKDAAAKAAREAELQRVQDIRALCGKHNIERKLEDGFIAGNKTVEEARAAILDKLAAGSDKNEIRSGSGDIEVVGDENTRKRGFMAEAIQSRVDPKHKLSEGAREYRYMSLKELARAVLVMQGVDARGMTPMEIADRSLMSTGDFANILSDVMGKRLRAAYVEQPATYTQWARRAANAPDFKDIKPMVLSNAPDLLAVPAGAEFKTGTLSDGKETYQITTFGRIISFTRQALINDDLRAFERFPSAFAGSARRLENRTVYNQLLNNGALADTIALFHASHSNLRTGTVIDAANLTAARSAMRGQKGLQQEELNLAPAFLLCGAAYEQSAYQFTSSQYVPAKPSDVNEFRTGGRTSVTPIVDAVITGNKWFMACNSSDCDTVEYCYLDGNEGVFLESRLGFTVDGVDMKARLDFAAKAIDYRGLQYNPGA